MLIINLVGRIIMPGSTSFFIVIGLFLFGFNSSLLSSESIQWLTHDECDNFYKQIMSGNKQIFSSLTHLNFTLDARYLHRYLSPGDVIMLHKDIYGNNILHHACNASHLELVEIMLNHTAGFLNSQNNLGISPLYYITDPRICLKYLEYNPDLHQKDSLNRMPLAWHIEQNNIDIAVAILMHAKKIKLSFMLEKPFAHAKSLDMVKALSCNTVICSTISQDEWVSINKPHDQSLMVTQETAEGFTLVCNPENSLVHVRLKAKEAFWSSMNTQSNINITNIFKETLLHHAVRENRPEVIKKLFDKGIDVYAQNSKGETALHLAVCCNNKDMVIFLLECIATLPISNSVVSLLEKKDSDGATALMLAVQENKSDMITLLIDRGSDIYTKNKYKHSLLHFVKDPLLAEHLIIRGLSVHDVGIFGNTPLHFAANHQVAQVLVDNNADINGLTHDMNTPLHTAKTTKIAQLLVAAYANMDYRNVKGQTPLHIAVLNNNVLRCKLLIDSGSDLNTRDYRNRTAFNLLQANKYKIPYADFVQEGLENLFHQKTLQPYAVRHLIEVVPADMQFSMDDDTSQGSNLETQIEVDFIMQEQQNETMSNSPTSVIP